MVTSRLNRYAYTRMRCHHHNHMTSTQDHMTSTQDTPPGTQPHMRSMDQPPGPHDQPTQQDTWPTGCNDQPAAQSFRLTNYRPNRPTWPKPAIGCDNTCYQLDTMHYTHGTARSHRLTHMGNQLDTMHYTHGQPTNCWPTTTIGGRRMVS